MLNQNQFADLVADILKSAAGNDQHVQQALIQGGLYLSALIEAYNFIETHDDVKIAWRNSDLGDGPYLKMTAAAGPNFIPVDAAKS